MLATSLAATMFPKTPIGETSEVNLDTISVEEARRLAKSWAKKSKSGKLPTSINDRNLASLLGSILKVEVEFVEPNSYTEHSLVAMYTGPKPLSIDSKLPKGARVVWIFAEII